MTKMTYVNAIDFAINFIGEASETNENGEIVRAYPEIVEKLTALKAQLEKRASGERKPTKAQKENEALKAEIMAFLRDTENGVQCKDVASHFEVSGQKMSALLKQLVDNGLCEKYVEKRVTYFKAVEG